MRILRCLLSIVLFAQFSLGKNCTHPDAIKVGNDCIIVGGSDDDMTILLHDFKNNKTYCQAGDCSSDPNSNGHHAEGQESSQNQACTWGESCSQSNDSKDKSSPKEDSKITFDNPISVPDGDADVQGGNGSGGGAGAAAGNALALGVKSYFDSRAWYNQQKEIEQQTRNRRNATKNEMDSLGARNEQLSRKFEQDRKNLIAQEILRKQEQRQMIVSEYKPDPILESKIDSLTEIEFRLKESAITRYKLKLEELIRLKSYVSAVKIIEAFYENKLSNYPANNYFNKNGILTPERIDSKIPKSPFSNENLVSAKGTAYGQIVRRAVNQFQALWAEQQGYKFAPKLHRSYVAMAGMLLRQMDGLFGKATLSELQIYLRQYNQILRFLGGVGISFVNLPADFHEALALFPDFIQSWIAEHKDEFTDIPQSISVLAQAGISIAEILTESFVHGLYEDGEKILSMEPDQLGEVAGKFIANRILGKILHGSNSKSSVHQGSLETLPESEAALGQLLKPIFQDKEFQNLSAQMMEEVRHLNEISTPGFRKLIQQKASEDLAMAVDGVRAYSNLKKIPGDSLLKEQAEEVARLVMQEKRQVRDFLNGVIDSQRMPSQRFTSLRTPQDIPRLGQQYEVVDQAVRKAQDTLKAQAAQPIQGFRARYIPKQFTDSEGNVWKNYPENAFKPHNGTAVTRNRLGYGGPSGEVVVSSGFGNTPEEAARVARGEVVSYGGSPDSMLLATQPVKTDNFKVLDFRDKNVESVFKERGLIKQLLEKKDHVFGYDSSNMLGHSARRLGYDGVILDSVPDIRFEGGDNFHKFME